MSLTGVLLGISNVSIAVLVILASLPLLRGHVKMNRMYGARFKQSFVSDENWYKINRYAAKQAIGWSFVLFLSGVAAFFVKFEAESKVRIELVLLFALAPLLIVIPALTSYWYARRL
jgi:hypothetical protein